MVMLYYKSSFGTITYLNNSIAITESPQKSNDFLMPSTRVLGITRSASAWHGKVMVDDRPNCVIAEDVKSYTYCCYVICMRFLSFAFRDAIILV